MKKSVFSCILILVSCFYIANAQSPAWQWAKNAGGNNGANSSNCIITDEIGNLYITGIYHSSPGIFGNDTIINNVIGSASNIYVAKIDTSGNWQWVLGVKGASGESYDLAMDENNDIYVTGNFRKETNSSDTAIFGNDTLISTGNADIFVAKINNTLGKWMWAVKAGGKDFDRSFGIHVESSRNIYVTGTFTNTATFGNHTIQGIGYCEDIFVAKLNVSEDENSSIPANWQWAIGAGSNSHDGGKKIIQDANGDIYVTGYFGWQYSLPLPANNYAIFGSDTLTSNGNSDVFVAKIDTAGNWQWVVSAGGAGVDKAYSLVADSSNNIYIVGSIQSPAVFGNNILNTTNYSDGFIAKIDASGNWQNVKNSNEINPIYDVTADVYDNLYIIGDGDSSIVAKLDTAYNLQWFAKINEKGKRGESIIVDKSNNVYITGSYGDNITFGNIKLPHSGPGPGIFVAKLNTNLLTNINTTIKNVNINIFPNPSNGIINIETKGVDAGKEDLKVEIANLSGQVIFSKDFSNNTIKQIDLSNQPKGIYFLKLMNEDVVRVEKIVIQ